MKKTLSALALSAVAALTLTACGNAPAPETKSADSGSKTATTTDAKSNFKACMVSDSGGFNDKSFNESGKIGLDKAGTDLGVEVRTAESNNESDFTPNLNAMVQDKCDYIIGVGFLMTNAVLEAAQANKNTNFALVDSVFTKDSKIIQIPNGKPLVFDTAQAGYLAGYVAAAMTKTGKVAAYVGMKIPSTAIFADGFSDGIAKYNADNGKNVKLLGWDKEKQDGTAIGDFNNTAKGKQFTTNFISQGADIILPIAGPVGIGTLQAVKEANTAGKHVSVIWVDNDGAISNPNYKDIILTSIMKKIGESVYDSIKEAKDGKFNNTPYVGTLANKGVDIAPYHEFDSKVPAEVKEKVNQLREDIISGKIKVESKNSPKG